MNRTLGQLARTALDLGVPTDGHLLADFIARRDDGAFAHLVRRHGPMVLAVCRRVLRHQQDAEDAFQATFLVLARKADDVWPRDAVGAWLHGVAYRVAMKARGVRAKLARREHPLEDVPQPFTEPACPDLAGVLDRAVRKLPEVYRAAVVACDLEGRSRKDAAAQLGWKEGTLSGRLSRARQLLAARLKQAGLAVPVGAMFTNNTAGALPVKLADAVVRAALGSHAAGVSAPVAALTEGVVRSMFLVKTKMVAVTVFAACAMGFGVWSATGQQGPGTTGGATAEQPTTKRVSVAVVPSDLDRMQQGEWIMGQPRLENINGGVPKSVVENMIQSAKREGTLTVRDGKMMFRPQVETRGTSTTGESGGGATSTTTVTPRTFTITLDPTQTPKHIDLTDDKGKVTRGIYLLEDQYFYLVLNSNGGRPKEFQKLVPKYEMRWVMWQPQPPEPNGADAVPGPRVELASLELNVMVQEINSILKLKNIEPIMLERLRARADAARTLLGAPAPPAKTEAAKAQEKVNVASMKALAAQLELSDAQIRLDQARATAAVARAQLGSSELALKEATAKLAAAQKGNVKAPAPATFTLHIRTQFAAEKVETLKLTGSETVLDVIANSADASRLTQTASLWIVRGGDALTIYWADITQRGETKTNYQILNGDQVFVQVNVK